MKPMLWWTRRFWGSQKRMGTRPEQLSIHLSCEEAEADVGNFSTSFNVIHVGLAFTLKGNPVIHKARDTSRYTIFEGQQMLLLFSSCIQPTGSEPPSQRSAKCQSEIVSQLHDILHKAFSESFLITGSEELCSSPRILILVPKVGKDEEVDPSQNSALGRWVVLFRWHQVSL